LKEIGERESREHERRNSATSFFKKRSTSLQEITNKGIFKFILVVVVFVSLNI
jgi:hypothetical protein